MPEFKSAGIVKWKSGLILSRVDRSGRHKRRSDERQRHLASPFAEFGRT